MNSEATQIIRLFEIIEEAKDHEQYEVANAAFFVLFDQWSQDEAHKDDFTITIETDDGSGEWDCEYYDLVALSYGEHYGCIPVPLLSPEQVAIAFKRGTTVDRPRHGERDYSEAAPSQVTFWILEIVGASPNQYARNYIYEKFVDVLHETPVHALAHPDDDEYQKYADVEFADDHHEELIAAITAAATDEDFDDDEDKATQ